MPPKDRRFLGKNKTFHYRGIKGWVHVGYEWTEMYWDETDNKYRVWAGKDGTFTTNPAIFDEWAELPREIYKKEG